MDRLQDFQEVLAAAVLTTLLIIGLDAGLIPGPNCRISILVPTVSRRSGSSGSEIDEVFAGVIERDELATKDGFRIDWTKFQLMVFDQRENARARIVAVHEARPAFATPPPWPPESRVPTSERDNPVRQNSR